MYSRKYNFRLIHFSTDCIFSGVKGNYTIYDIPDSNDIYGQSKFLGEIHAPNNLTIRTSIIGHELNSSLSLVDWFLSQEKEVCGYKNAIFSGLPTVEIAEMMGVKQPQVSNWLVVFSLILLGISQNLGLN